MKVIDLLNKIANGEKMPKKIIFRGYEYWYEENMEDYKNAQTEYSDYIIGSKFHHTNWLNDEIEIIEEDKKIEKLDIRQEKNIKNNWKWVIYGEEHKYCISTPQKIIGDKINELIDEVNKLKGDNNE
jgi:hypothetical protein